MDRAYHCGITNFKKLINLTKQLLSKGVRYDLRTAQETEAKVGISQSNAMYSAEVDLIFKTLAEALQANVGFGKSIYVLNEKFYTKDNTAFIPKKATIVKYLKQ